MFKLAAALDQTLASLNDPILAALVVPHPEAFIRLFWISLAVTAAVVPWLARREQSRADPVRDEARDLVGAETEHPLEHRAGVHA
jgi:hypothetical protein